MKTTFKEIYLPIKEGITGNIMKEENKVYNELITSLSVNYTPNKPIGKWCINVVYFHKNIVKRLYYAKTIKEIRILVNDINDFKFNPMLFLNQ
jgi:tRNA A-37 threonylcarbamoyl transferase component Bud32